MTPIGECVIAILLIVLISVVVYQVRIDGYTRKRMFDIQIEMAQAQQSMTKDLTWTDLKKIVNDIISFTVSNYIMVNGIAKMSDEELSIMWTSILNDACTRVDLSISDEIKRQMLKNITGEYFTQFIKNSVEITFAFQLTRNKNNEVNDKLMRIQQAVPSIDTKK